MVVLALSLALAAATAPAAPLAPPLERGVAKNGVAIVAVPTTSPWTVAVLAIARPDGMGADAAEATLPGLAAAARAAAGRDGSVEVTWRPGSFALVITTPAGTADAALRGVDAALKAARSAPPKTPAPLPAPWRGQRKYQVVPSGDVASAFKALSAIGSAHVAVAVVGPGSGTDLLRRAQGLVGATLAKDAVRSREALDRREDDAGEHVSWSALAPGDVAALEVVADVIGAHVHRDEGAVSVGLPSKAGEARTHVAAFLAAPPSQALVDDVAHARRLALAAAIDDQEVLAVVLARDTLSAGGSDTFAAIDALGSVEPDAVMRAAAALLELLP